MIQRPLERLGSEGFLHFCFFSLSALRHDEPAVDRNLFSLSSSANASLNKCQRDSLCSLRLLYCFYMAGFSQYETHIYVDVTFNSIVAGEQKNVSEKGIFEKLWLLLNPFSLFTEFDSSECQDGLTAELLKSLLVLRST